MVRIFILALLLYPVWAFSQIQLLNDEFAHDSTLFIWQNINTTEGWNAEHLEVFDINTSTPGKLHMMPHTTSWYEDYRGPLLYKEVVGNFIFTTEVSSTNRTANGIPTSAYSLAGPMIRTPRNEITTGLNDWTYGGENYIFLSIGMAAGGNPPHFEVKNTVNSNSNLQIVPVDTNHNVQIRLARIDQHIICLYKVPDGNWTIRRRYNRGNFPDTMQIGLVTYTDWFKLSSFPETYANSHIIDATADPDSSNNPGRAYDPDLIGTFEFARFDSAYVPPALVGANLSNTGAVSDATLLEFLGYPSQPYIPNNYQYQTDSTGILVLPDPTNTFINIYGDFTNYNISIVDTLGNIFIEYPNAYRKITIDVDEVPSNPHFIIIENTLNDSISVQRIIPE